MRDGVKIARRGIPALALVTEDFRAQADFVARSVGMPDAPRIVLPHPLAGTGAANLQAVAEQFAGQMVAALRGPS